MCRNQKYCTELGIDPLKWDRKSPLPPPEDFKQAHKYLADSLKFIFDKDISSAREILKSPLEGIIKNWYIEHGQMSGEHRFKGLGSITEAKVSEMLDPLKSIKAFELQVYERDDFKCRYCSNVVMHEKNLKLIESKVGSSYFKLSGKSNEERHGFVYVVRATVDHVLPHSRGGLTNLDNLVTSCWSCNYGKSGYTLGEIGLDDPRG